MRVLIVTFLLVICQLSKSSADDYVVSTRKFPSYFQFGLATAAQQIEGAWNEDGKGENIWDRYSHEHPEAFANGENGDISSDSYHKYKIDVALMKDFGVKAYRFSIAWSRIFPTGFATEVNQPGLQFYKNLIAELKAAGIEPLVTMYHWDLPTPLQDVGGFLNDSIVDHFERYATVLFDEFGDDVKFWTTFNEPLETCMDGYGSGGAPPNIAGSGISEYICAHNLIKAHGRVYRLYEKNYKSKQGGRVGMVINASWFEPASTKAEDIEASNRRLLFEYGWFAHPIFFGDYPDIMKERIAARSKLEGYEKSRLPEFTEEEKTMIKGTADYLAINMYTSFMAVHQDDAAISKPNHWLDVSVGVYQDSSWETTASDWFKVVPWGARKLLVWLKNTYNNPEIIVTENGYVDLGEKDDLDTRGRYHKLYLSNIQDAMYEDGVNVTGYMAWSLLDNWEWQYAYSRKLGFYYVDFSDPDRPRTPKASQAYFKQVVTTYCLVDQCTD